MQIVMMAVLVVGLIVVMALLLSVPTWLLWNWLMPVIFKLPEISFLQALGLLILTGFLFQSGGSSSK